MSNVISNFLCRLSPALIVVSAAPKLTMRVTPARIKTQWKAAIAYPAVWVYWANRFVFKKYFPIFFYIGKGASSLKLIGIEMN